MKIFRQKARFIPAALLICGTCVGAGMLGLPVVTGPAGWAPALTVNVVTFLLMLLTGIYFAEATLWLPDESNLMSMAGKLLGKWGKWIGGLSFLFLYYCLMIAYVAGGAPLFEAILPMEHSIIPFAIVFLGIIMLGARKVGKINALLMVGLVVSYFMLLGAATPFVSEENLAFTNWSISPLAAPILLSAYGFHNVIPTLSTYLKRDRKQIYRSILLGTILSLVIYSLWQWVIIGAIPQEVIAEAGEQGIPITEALQHLTNHPQIVKFSTWFGFFALTTSLLGVSLSMVDFLGDGLKIKRTGWSRFFLCLLIFVPPTILAKIYPKIFMDALGLAGGIGEAILNGLIPIFMVWAGVYYKKLTGPHKFLTHRALLGFATLLTLLIMVIELRNIL